MYDDIIIIDCFKYNIVKFKNIRLNTINDISNILIVFSTLPNFS